MGASNALCTGVLPEAAAVGSEDNWHVPRTNHLAPLAGVGGRHPTVGLRAMAPGMVTVGVGVPLRPTERVRGLSGRVGGGRVFQMVVAVRKC